MQTFSQSKIFYFSAHIYLKSELQVTQPISHCYCLRVLLQRLKHLQNCIFRSIFTNSVMKKRLRLAF